MEISVNMKQFQEKFVWNSDTVSFGDMISKTNGKFFTFYGDVYKRLLTDMNIFFVAK